MNIFFQNVTFYDFVPFFEKRFLAASAARRGMVFRR